MTKHARKRKRGNGEGSIYKLNGGRWRGAISVGKGPSGKPKRKIFTKATRHEVQDELAKALRDAQIGIPIITGTKTVAEYLEDWLKDVPARVRPKTLRTYTDLVRNHITPSIGTIPLRKLSPKNVRGFLSSKLAIPETLAGSTTPTRKALSPRTVKHLLVTLRTALAVALKDGEVARNVATLVDPPRCSKVEMQAFSPVQARAFMDAVQGSRFEAAFTAAVAIGLRQGEILGLQWPDVDLASGKLTVRGALQRVDKKLVRVELKSRTSMRTIQLPAVCVSAFAQHKGHQDGWRRWAGSRWQETGYVFTTRIGTPTDARELLKEYYSITRPKPKTEGTEAQKLAFPPIRFHDLRHSAATLLLAQGVSPRYITELLGHSQVSFTMETYAHVLDEVKKEVAVKMDEILARPPVATRVANKTRPARVS